MLIKKFTSNTSVFEISKESLRENYTHKGLLIHWNEIRDVTVYKQNHNTFLGLYLVDTDKKIPTANKLAQGMRNLNHNLSFPDIAYTQALLSGQKASAVAEALLMLKKKYNNPFKV